MDLTNSCKIEREIQQLEIILYQINKKPNIQLSINKIYKIILRPFNKTAYTVKVKNKDKESVTILIKKNPFQK